MTKILDCTTRDCGFITNWTFSDDYVFELMNKLNETGVEFFEIGYRNHFDIEQKGAFYTCSPEFLEKFYNKKGALKLGVMTDFKRFSIKDFPGPEKDFIDFVRIATHPDTIKETLDVAKSLYNAGYKVFIQLMDIANVETDGYIHLYSFYEKDIFESIYIADTYGVINPCDVVNFYSKLKMLGFNNISFHGHNNNGQVLKNTLKAINLGAYSVDVVNEIEGKNGGNLYALDLFSNLSNN